MGNRGGIGGWVGGRAVVRRLIRGGGRRSLRVGGEGRVDHDLGGGHRAGIREPVRRHADGIAFGDLGGRHRLPSWSPTLPRGVSTMMARRGAHFERPAAVVRRDHFASIDNDAGLALARQPRKSRATRPSPAGFVPVAASNNQPPACTAADSEDSPLIGDGVAFGEHGGLRGHGHRAHHGGGLTAVAFGSRPPAQFAARSPQRPIAASRRRRCRFKGSGAFVERCARQPGPPGYSQPYSSARCCRD